MKRIVLRCLVITVCLTIGFGVFLEQVHAVEGYPYGQRSNRMEGLSNVPRSGTGISLVSFIAHREPLKFSNRTNLRLRFYLPKPGNVSIVAVELHRHGPSHYQMRPLKTAWGAGWQEFFPWPIKDVLLPLKISPNAIGVLARLGEERPGSGPIVPVVLYANRVPPKVSQYTFHFLPHNTLSNADFSLTHIAKRSLARSRHLRNLTGNVPFKLTFDLSGRPEGDYHLLVKTKELGRTKGPSRQYLFRHKTDVRN